MSRNNIDDKIFKKEILIEKLNAKFSEIKEKLNKEKYELEKLKEEKELNELLKIKKAFKNEEDVSKFLEAIENKDINKVKKILDI